MAKFLPVNQIFFLLSILFFFFNQAECRVPEKYTDWFGRHKFFPMGYLAAGGNYMNEMFEQCFDNGELVKHVMKGVDLQNKNPNITASCTVVISHTDESILLAFRPTYGIDEQNEEVLTVAETTSFPGGGIVSKFYYNALMVLWNAGIKDAFLTSKNKNPSYEIWITGHSMGGALSSLMAAYLVQMKYTLNTNVKLMTFGEPRNGHKDFANRFPELVPWAYRVVHHNDLVPHSIPEALGYQHHRNEIWYNNTMEVNDPFIECDEPESKKCSDSVPANEWSVFDHGAYFGKKVRCIKTATPIFA
jgi:hypothetical protein